MSFPHHRILGLWSILSDIVPNNGRAKTPVRCVCHLVGSQDLFTSVLILLFVWKKEINLVCFGSLDTGILLE